MSDDAVESSAGLRPADAYIVAAIVFTLDQFSKMWVEYGFPYPGYSLSVIRPYQLVQLTFVRNTGAAWGILKGYESLFIAAALVVSGVCVWLIQQYWNHRLRYPVAMVLGGGLGNMADRVFLRSGVVDFIDVGVASYRWPTFNVADVALTLGIAWMAYYVVREDLLGGSESNSSRAE